MEESSSDRQSALFFRIFPVLVLGFAGGFFDSYTYVARGGVFCNAQTSNLLLMILGLASGRGVSSFRYLVPVAFFVVAIFSGKSDLARRLPTGEAQRHRSGHGGILLSSGRPRHRNPVSDGRGADSRFLSGHSSERIGLFRGGHAIQCLPHHARHSSVHGFLHQQSADVQRSCLFRRRRSR